MNFYNRHPSYDDVFFTLAAVLYIWSAIVVYRASRMIPEYQTSETLKASSLRTLAMACLTLAFLFLFNP